jgi:hypothetical protein
MKRKIPTLAQFRAVHRGAEAHKARRRWLTCLYWNRGLTVREVQKKLKRHGIWSSVGSIQRDLNDYMRSCCRQAGLPL